MLGGVVVRVRVDLATSNGGASLYLPLYAWLPVMVGFQYNGGASTGYPRGLLGVRNGGASTRCPRGLYLSLGAWGGIVRHSTVYTLPEGNYGPCWRAGWVNGDGWVNE